MGDGNVVKSSFEAWECTLTSMEEALTTSERDLAEHEQSFQELLNAPSSESLKWRVQAGLTQLLERLEQQDQETSTLMNHAQEFERWLDDQEQTIKQWHKAFSEWCMRIKQPPAILRSDAAEQ